MRCQNCGTENNESAGFCLGCGSALGQPIMPTPAVNVPTYPICPAWPEWQLEKQLGRGSYGTVYQATRNDNGVESHAAIKIISIPSDPSEIDALRREGMDIDSTRSFFKGVLDDFVGEIRVMESLKGIQNIVSVEDYKVVPKSESIGWDIYIRMELLTPFAVFVNGRSLSESDVIRLGCNICTALEICEQSNIIHRDIKPENIFINSFGHFKLGDFGIAKKLENVSGGMSQKGTFNYMAPEVASATDYDCRVDTYSLGIVLYRLLNGNKLPFITSEEQAMNHLERKAAVDRRFKGEPLPAPSDASAEMADVILRACAFDPNSRFSSASEMKAALTSVANGTYVPVLTAFVTETAQIDYDATVSVRKADSPSHEPSTQDAKPDSKVSSFGSSPKKEKKKINKAKVIVLCVLAAILALGITLAVLFFTGAPYSIYKDMRDCNHSRALSVYRSDVSGTFINETLLKSLLKDEVSRATENYESEKWDYAEVCDHLNTLDRMGIENAKSKQTEITEKYASSIVAKHKSSAISARTAKKEIKSLIENGYKNGAEKLSLINETETDVIVAKFMSEEFDYTQAKEALTVLVNDGYEKASEKIDEIGDIAADAIVSDYKAGDFTYAQAKQQLLALGSNVYNRNIHKLDEEQIETILSEAKALADKKDYRGAFNKIKLGLSSYPSSEILRQKEDEYNQALREQVKASSLAEAAALAEEGKYEEAMQLINDARYEYGEDEEYTNAYNTYNEAYTKIVKEEAFAAAEALAKQNDNWGAYQKIADAIEEVGEDEELKTKATEYENAYISSVLPQIDALLKENNVSEATEMIRDATAKFPDNEELKKRAETLDMFKTVLLNSLTPINGSFKWNDGTPKDPFDNGYNNLKNYVIFHSGGSYHNNASTYSSEYRVNKQYNALSFDVVPYSDFNINGSSYINIYVDDVLRYTSEPILQKTQPYNVFVDISDATYIKIIVHIGEKSCIMLSDVSLLSSPNYTSNLAQGYTSLSSLRAFNGSFSWENEYPNDVQQTSYKNSRNYTMLHAADGWSYKCMKARKHTTEYYLNQQYSSISFDMAPSDHYGANSSNRVKIYADDVLIYTSPEITKKTSKINSGKINISSANYIKIVVEIDDDGCMILSDVVLKNK